MLQSHVDGAVSGKTLSDLRGIQLSRHNHQHGLQRSGEDCRPPDADAEAFAGSSWHGAS